MALFFKKIGEGVPVKKCLKNWFAAFVLLCTAAVAHAQPTTYVATATGNYTLLTNFTLCVTGPCQNFNTGIGASGSFTTSAPLAANLAGANITPLVTAFSFSDGIHTYSSTDLAARIFLFNVSTNASGAITTTDIRIQRWLTGTSPHVPGDRHSWIFFQATGEVDHNAECLTVAASPAGVADSCTLVLGADTSRSLAFGSARVWSIAAAPVASAAISVPTLSEWGVILLVGLVALAAFVVPRHRFKVGKRS